MEIDWWTLGLQALNAIILLWVLSRFLFRPVADIMKKRREAVAAIMVDAEAAKAAARASEEKAQAEAAKYAADRGAFMAKAETAAQAAKDALLVEAQKEADKIRSDAKGAIAAMKQKEMADVTIHAGNLAADLAAKLLSRLPENARVSGFIDGLGEGIARLPEETKSGIGANGDMLRLKAARELTATEREASGAMLQKVLGRKVEFTTEVDPSVIAGLELQTAHALVKNSFRADLERIQAELTHHD